MPTSTPTSTTPSDAVDRVPLTFTDIGARVSGAAIVRRITQKTSRADTPYLDVDLGHAEGKTLVKVWSDAMPAWAEIREGQAVYVHLESKAGWRAGTLEWSLSSVVLLPDDHPIRDDVLPQYPVPAEELTARWDAVVARLSPAGRCLLDVVLDHVGRDAYDRMAAAERMHHAGIGGLKAHSLELAAFALAMVSAVPEYAGLSTDAIIVGCLLHDVGKLGETEVLRGVGIRRATLGWGRYHTTIGPEFVAVACALQAERLAAAGVTSAQIEHLKHVCESHHGDNRDHGSPTPPRSREAWLIHAADLASARLRQLTDDMAGLVPDADGWCRSPDGRRTPVFVPGAHDMPEATAHATPTVTADGDDASAGAAPPRPRPTERTLHLVVLRDTAAAVPLSPPLEETP
jgi:23S rRNA maturation-related 3'-5' exoribonuclease YhaM